MEHVNNSRWLDPPDPPTHGECYICSQVCDYGDMNARGSRCNEIYICDDCVQEYDDDKAREDNDD